MRRALAEVLSTPQPRPRPRPQRRAARHVELLPAEADRLLDAWFEQVDGMRALRHTGPELGVWAPWTGMVAGARAAIAKAGGADLDLRERPASRRRRADRRPARAGAPRGARETRLRHHRRHRRRLWRHRVASFVARP